MPRSIWKGSIAFGLVQIPVGIYPAANAKSLSFTLLDKRNFSPVGYERVNKKTGRKVEWDDIVKGYEYDKGEYVVLTDADFEAANVEATQTIDIVGFVDAAHIPTLYYDAAYYLAPTKAGRKAYALLREVLEREGKVGIAKVVIRTRQHLAALTPYGDALALILMRFADELRDPKDLDIPGRNLKALGVSRKEIDMAEALVSGMAEDWRPAQYRDEYRDDLLKLIEKRAKEGQINTVSETKPKKRRAKGPEIVDLAELLKQSVLGRANENRGARGGKKRGKAAKGSVRKTRTERALRKAG
jgi:DNA end-binding protein Ku